MPSEQADYLGVEEVVHLHDRAIRRYGGKSGIFDAGALESSVAQPQMTVFGYERFPTLSQKAAAYCFFIARNHPFNDGNKRTAFLAALHFLVKNGVVPILDQDELYDTISAVAAGECGLDELTSVFRKACP